MKKLLEGGVNYERPNIYLKNIFLSYDVKLGAIL